MSVALAEIDTDASASALAHDGSVPSVVGLPGTYISLTLSISQAACEAYPKVFHPG
jgi:hypothetical protein